MRATEAYADLLRLKRPVVTTGEVAARLRIAKPTASKLLRRLAADGVITRIRRGLWALTSSPDPSLLPESLTAPYPSYVSTWTALYRHGMIDQIPREIYIASVDRSKRIKTPVGMFIVQHVTPDLFGGFQASNGTRVATPEKALFDTVYLAESRGKRFASLPELDLPSGFDEAELGRWVQRIASSRLRTLVAQRLNEILTHAERE